jgi:branched-chain amino acid transport system ATP-binding protein
VDRVFDLFPHLAELRYRRGGQISGGEQQMLTIARALMGNPLMLLLDEPSTGLAPRITEHLARAVLDLKAAGLAVLLSEQNLRFAAAVADQAVVMETGHVRWCGSMAEFLSDPAAARSYLHV